MAWDAFLGKNEGLECIEPVFYGVATLLSKPIRAQYLNGSGPMRGFHSGLKKSDPVPPSLRLNLKCSLSLLGETGFPQESSGPLLTVISTCRQTWAPPHKLSSLWSNQSMWEILRSNVHQDTFRHCSLSQILVVGSGYNLVLFLGSNLLKPIDSFITKSWELSNLKWQCLSS